MENFLRLATDIQVEPLVENIFQKVSAFELIIARQKTPGSAHTDTEAVILRWAKDLSLKAVFTDIEAVDYPTLDIFPEAKLLIQMVSHVVAATKLGRAMIVSLKPGGFIKPHFDEGAYSDHYQRFHLSLQSDEGNLFYVETKPGSGIMEEVHMRTGELWWFNHKHLHCVHNGSSRPRLHLILDAVAPAFRQKVAA